MNMFSSSAHKIATDIQKWWNKNVVFTVLIDEDWAAAWDWYAEDPENRLIVTPHEVEDPSTVDVYHLLKHPERYGRAGDKELLFVDAVQILKTVFHQENVWGTLVLRDDEQEVVFLDEQRQRKKEMIQGVRELIDE